MMKPVLLTAHQSGHDLFPFSLTRSVADIRVGVLTIREKWAAFTGGGPAPEVDEAGIADGTAVPANFVPSFNGFTAALNGDFSQGKFLHRAWDIFMLNDWAIREDFKLITENRSSIPIPGTVAISGQENIFIEEGAELSHCTINARTGPVYIGKNAVVMEGTVIRGPVAICEGATVKMGSKIYGATTIGPYSVAGGEIKNSVISAYSNKAHDGYLGDSVIGQWCNLGAGTCNSNLKNDAGEISIYDHTQGKAVKSGLYKCGLLMGDYSRAAINTSFNTGTVVGVCANVFGSGLSPKYIPSFSWGSDGSSKYQFEKALEHISNWKKLKGAVLDEQEKRRLRLIFEQN